MTWGPNFKNYLKKSSSIELMKKNEPCLDINRLIENAVNVDTKVWFTQHDRQEGLMKVRLCSSRVQIAGIITSTFSLDEFKCVQWKVRNTFFKFCQINTSMCTTDNCDFKICTLPFWVKLNKHICTMRNWKSL